MIKLENDRNILGYKLPSHYVFNEKNIGNKLEDFEILQVMGEGSYGFIAKVQSKINQKIYALKKNIIENMGIAEQNQMKNELLFLKYFNHPNVCNCLANFEKDNCCYIVMELFENKDLFKYLSANCNLGFRINEETMWDIFHQCLEGLLYLHNLGVIHRDIKPGNIFMDNKGNIKIGDFGISAVMSLNQAAKLTDDPQKQQKLVLQLGKFGTDHYMAPEVENEEFYDQRADVYSLGVCFYGLCYYSLPYFGGKNMNELVNDNLGQSNYLVFTS